MSEKLAGNLVILASESRSDTTSRAIENDQFRGGDFFVRQTAQGSTTAFVSVKLQGQVPGSTEWYTIGTISPATTATFTKRLRVYPGASTALNSTGLDPTVLNDFLPSIFRVASTNVSTSAVTFSVSAHLFA
jgi:hypothetical protein